MNVRRRLRLEWLAALAFVLVGALLIGLWHPGERSRFWQGVEGRLLDARFAVRGPLPPPDGVAIVALDNAAMSRLATFPPPRALLAEAVSAALDAGARTVALDFLLVDARPDDPALAAALSAGDTILGVAEAAPEAPLPALRDRDGFALVTGPATGEALPALGPATTLQAAARLGHVAVTHGPDGALRRMRPALAVATRDGIALVPGLAVAAVAGAAGDVLLLVPPDGVGGWLDIAASRVQLDLRGQVPLDYYGPRGTIPTVSIFDIAQADLRGRIVFIGATAVGFGDRHATSFDPALPGVEAQATLAANILADRVLRRDGAVWLGSVALAAGAAAAGLVAAGLARPVVAAGATALATTGAAAVLHVAFVAGWWLDGVTAVLSLALGVVAGAGLRRYDHGRRAANLARYQSPALVDALAVRVDPLGGRAPQPAVVLFVDVADFTAHAERIGPLATDAFLKLFQGLVADAAERCGGVIAHFAGDGALVVFGLPEPGPRDAAEALRFVGAFFAAVRACPDWPGLGVRLGGHAGLVQLGVLGGARHRHVSVSGDAVNTASRLQDVAKTRDATLALSGSLIARAPDGADWVARAGLTKVEDLRLRGRTMPETAWVGDPPR